METLNPPATMSPERLARRARHAAFARRGTPADDPRVIATRQDITADRLGDQIRAALEATPLRPEQIGQLVTLLASGGAR